MVRFLILYCFSLISFTAFLQESIESEVKEVDLGIRGDLYSPVLFGNQVVFCGNQKDRVVFTVIGNDGNEPSDLYVFTPGDSLTVSSFAPSMRTIYYDGPATFNDSGTICIVSQNIVTDRKFRRFSSDINRLGLNEFHLVDNEWQFFRSLPFNDTSYNCTHPFLSPDGKSLYFSSDRSGGFGGFDIWKSQLVDGEWSTPFHLGKHINTSANEVFPTLVDNELYFSSDRGAFGGLDIYTFDSVMGTLQALPVPINSSADDFGIVSNNRLKNGYFSSNRTTKDAIWAFTFLRPIFEQCDSLIVNDYCYTLAEENALALDEIPSLIYQWDINGEKRNGIEIDYCFPGPGEYFISLDIIDTIINAVYSNQAQYELILENEEQPYITSIDRVKINEPFLLSSDETNLPNVIIEDYFWTISDGSFYNEPNPTHHFTQEGNYRVELGILGTLFGEDIEDCVYKTVVCVGANQPKDTIAAPNKNNLSNGTQQPAFSEETRLLDQGDSTQIVYFIELAKSKERLIIEDEIPADLRNDFYIKSAYNAEDSLYSYYVGEYSKITDAHEVWYEIVGKGHDVFVRSRRKDEIVDIPLDQAIIMGTILFEFNESQIKDEFKPELDKIISWMSQMESLNLVISAHTDNVGSEQKNKQLSQERAIAILDYFSANGIDRSRLIAHGYGEEKPISTNTTEEGRKNNRRVEFELKIK